SDAGSVREMSKSSVRKKCSFTIESILSSLPASYSAEVQLKRVLPLCCLHVTEPGTRHQLLLNLLPVTSLEQVKARGVCEYHCCTNSTGSSQQDITPVSDTCISWPRRLLPPILRAVEPHTPVRSTDPQVLHQIQRRTRRHRTIFTEGQLEALETLFHQNQYPDIITREQLAVQIQLREERVEV
uniref:Goosecoid homeobox 2 n=1 Tax=Latimeria chalumnae TaxID=7897 RepID=H3AE11_LATCH